MYTTVLQIQYYKYWIISPSRMYEILKKVEEDQLKKSYMNLEMKGSSSIMTGGRGQDGQKFSSFNREEKFHFMALVRCGSSGRMEENGECFEFSCLAWIPPKNYKYWIKSICRICRILRRKILLGTGFILFKT